MTPKPKFYGIVMPARGLTMRGAPTPTAATVRTVICGARLEIYDVLEFEGVRYASVVPASVTRPEWARVAERDNSIVYLDIFPIEPTPEESSAIALTGIAKALDRIASALEAK